MPARVVDVCLDELSCASGLGPTRYSSWRVAAILGAYGIDHRMKTLPWRWMTGRTSSSHEGKTATRGSASASGHGVSLESLGASEKRRKGGRESRTHECLCLCSERQSRAARRGRGAERERSGRARPARRRSPPSASTCTGASRARQGSCREPVGQGQRQLAVQARRAAAEGEEDALSRRPRDALPHRHCRSARRAPGTGLAAQGDLPALHRRERGRRREARVELESAASRSWRASCGGRLKRRASPRIRRDRGRALAQESACARARVRACDGVGKCSPCSLGRARARSRAFERSSRRSRWEDEGRGRGQVLARRTGTVAHELYRVLAHRHAQAELERGCRRRPTSSRLGRRRSSRPLLLNPLPSTYACTGRAPRASAHRARPPSRSHHPPPLPLLPAPSSSALALVLASHRPDRPSSQHVGRSRALQRRVQQLRARPVHLGPPPARAPPRDPGQPPLRAQAAHRRVGRPRRPRPRRRQAHPPAGSLGRRRLRPRRRRRAVPVRRQASQQLAVAGRARPPGPPQGRRRRRRRRRGRRRLGRRRRRRVRARRRGQPDARRARQGARPVQDRHGRQPAPVRHRRPHAPQPRVQRARDADQVGGASPSLPLLSPAPFVPRPSTDARSSCRPCT